MNKLDVAVSNVMAEIARLREQPILFQPEMGSPDVVKEQDYLSWKILRERMESKIIDEYLINNGKDKIFLRMALRRIAALAIIQEMYLMEWDGDD